MVGGGFLAGVVLAKFSGWGYALELFLGLLAVSIFFLRRRFTQRLLPTIIVVGMVALALGGARWELAEQNRTFLATPTPPKQLVEAQFVIIDEPEERDTSTVLIARWQKTGQAMRLSASRHLGVNKGDTIAVTGEVSVPSITLPNTNFNYREYLARQGIFYQVYANRVELVAPAPWWHFSRLLINFKEATLTGLGQFIPEPEVSLLGGLLIGAKAGLGAEWAEVFRRAGLSHIIVLSGYNMTIVVETITRGLGFLALGLRGGVGIVGIVLFALMANSGAATVRAALMASLAILARLTGRVYEVTFALMFSALVMTLYNPRVVFELGFQLSFLATLGLLYLVPMLEPFFQWLPERFGLRLIVTATLAAQLAVTPLLLFTTAQLSLVALLANVLVLPIIPLMMLLGFMTAITGWIFSPLGAVVGFITSLGLGYILWVAKTLTAIPGAAVILSSFPAGLMWLMYAGLLWWWLRSRPKMGPPIDKNPALGL